MNGGEPRISQDEDVRQAWHAASDESPPPRVDATILAAARDAARRPGRADDATRVRPWYHAWQPLMAAAAIAGLAFALVQTIPLDTREAMLPGASAPAGAPTESQVRATAQARAEPAGKVEQQAVRDASPASPAENPVGKESGAGSLTYSARLESGSARKSAAGVEQRTESPAPVAATAPVPPPDVAGSMTSASPPAAAPAPAPRPDVADSLLSTSPSAVASRERAAAPEDAEATDADLQTNSTRTAVDARVERIVTLYRSGDRSGAATELRALRADVQGADARLPSSLRAWARTVH